MRDEAIRWLDEALQDLEAAEILQEKTLCCGPLFSSSC